LIFIKDNIFIYKYQNILRKYLKSKSGGDLSLTDVSGAINHPVRINPTKPTLL
jgi:hypothetical protein